MLRPVPRILIFLGLVLVSDAQTPSPWHGRVIGIEDAPNGQTRNLTYTDLENVSQHGVLAADSEVSYVMDAKSTTVYVYKRRLTAQGEVGRSLEIIPLNSTGAARSIDYPPVCTACPGCGGCTPDQPQIAVSTDGHYVFTAMGRIQEHQSPQSPGQIANDNDASFVQQIIVPYDTVAGQFLDALVFPPSFGGLLLPSSTPDGFELLMGDRSLVRYRVAGREIQKDSLLGELPFPGGRYHLIRDPENRRMLFLFENGTVIEEAAGKLNQSGNIGSLPASRRMYSAAVSGNGKLLFVPTGPATWPVNKFASGAYVDQIDVYDAATLARLRSLHSQRPLLDVIPNHNGSRLYAAIPGRPLIVVLNSDTLWQEEEHLTQFPIRQMTFLP